MNNEDVNDLDRFLSAVQAYIKKRLYDQAILLAEKRIMSDNDDIDAMFVKGICLVGMGQEEEAGDILRSVDDAIRRWSGLYMLLGETCRTMKLIPQAGRAYRYAGALKAAAHACEDMKTERERGSHESEREGSPALGGLAPDFHTVTLADLYIKQGHFEMARAVLKSVTAHEPDNAGAHERLGYVETMLICGKKGAAHRTVVEELERWLKHLGQRRPPEESRHPDDLQ